MVKFKKSPKSMYSNSKYNLTIFKNHFVTNIKSTKPVSKLGKLKRNVSKKMDSVHRGSLYVAELFTNSPENGHTRLDMLISRVQ